MFRIIQGRCACVKKAYESEVSDGQELKWATATVIAGLLLKNHWIFISRQMQYFALHLRKRDTKNFKNQIILRRTECFSIEWFSEQYPWKVKQCVWRLSVQSGLCFWSKLWHLDTKIFHRPAGFCSFSFAQYLCLMSCCPHCNSPCSHIAMCLSIWRLHCTVVSLHV